MNKKIFLLHIPQSNTIGGTLHSRSIMRMSLGYPGLAEYLIRHGFPAEIIHLGIEEMLDPAFDIVDVLKEEHPLLAGSSMNWHFQMKDTLEVMRKVKRELPGLFLVLGGITASVFFDDILRDYPFIDGVIRGDGEQPLLQLAKALTRGGDFSRVPNLSYRKNGKITHNPITYTVEHGDIDELDCTWRGVVRNHETYFSTGMKQFFVSDALLEKECDNPVYVYLGRGCTDTCPLCAGAKDAQKCYFNRKKMVLRSPERVFQFIKEHYAKGARYFNFPFNPSGMPRDYFAGIFKKMREHGMTEAAATIEFCHYLPSPGFISEFSQTFRPDQSTVVIIFASLPGVCRNKHFNYDHYSGGFNEALKNIHDAGIKSGITVRLYPGDTWKTVMDTYEWSKSAASKYNISINLRPEIFDPGSSLHLKPEEFNAVTHVRSMQDFIDMDGKCVDWYTTFAEDTGFKINDLNAKTAFINAFSHNYWSVIRQFFNASAIEPFQTHIGCHRSSIEQIAPLLKDKDDSIFTFLVFGVGSVGQLAEVCRLLGKSARRVSGIVPITYGKSQRSISDDERYFSHQYRTFPLKHYDRTPAGGDSRVITLFTIDSQEDFLVLLDNRSAAENIVDVCKWAGTCSARTGNRMFVNPGGRTIKFCHHSDVFPLEKPADAVKALSRKFAKTMKRRGCEKCEMNARCAKCMYPHPFDDTSYCRMVSALHKNGK